MATTSTTAQSQTFSSKAAEMSRSLGRDIKDFNGQCDSNTTDGRVKDPVPHKLQGLGYEKNGNFSVMHIGRGSTAKMDRNAAAKRTSEETEAAARLANEGGYQSVKRKKLAWSPSNIALGLSPRKTKFEQARLLTLLRSIHPLLVVEQLCKALAYFGGIPGAPAPSDTSAFPQSADTNGTGAVFVGWIAEIFPNGDIIQRGTRATSPNPPILPVRPPTPVPEEAPAVVESTVSESAATESTSRRGRGRPKGSRTTRNKDRASISGAEVNQAPTSTGDNGQATEQTALAHPPSITLSSSDAVPNSSTSKKRGRPKGSKNKPKPSEHNEAATLAVKLPVSALRDENQQNSETVPSSSQSSTTQHLPPNAIPSMNIMRPSAQDSAPASLVSVPPASMLRDNSQPIRSRRDPSEANSELHVPELFTSTTVRRVGANVASNTLSAQVSLGLQDNSATGTRKTPSPHTLKATDSLPKRRRTSKESHQAQRPAGLDQYQPSRTNVSIVHMRQAGINRSPNVFASPASSLDSISSSISRPLVSENSARNTALAQQARPQQHSSTLPARHSPQVPSANHHTTPDMIASLGSRRMGSHMMPFDHPHSSNRQQPQILSQQQMQTIVPSRGDTSSSFHGQSRSGAPISILRGGASLVGFAGVEQGPSLSRSESSLSQSLNPPSTFASDPCRTTQSLISRPPTSSATSTTAPNSHKEQTYMNWNYASLHRNG